MLAFGYYSIMYNNKEYTFENKDDAYVFCDEKSISYYEILHYHYES